MIIKLTTSDLASEPVSLTEAKNHLRIADYTSDDALIMSLIRSSRTHLEKYTGLSFGTKTITAILSIAGDYELPYGPVCSVTSAATYDDGTWVPTTDYTLVGDMLDAGYKGLIKVVYQAGFAPLPEDLKTDILQLVAWQYQNRGIALAKGSQKSDFPNYLNATQFKKGVI